MAKPKREAVAPPPKRVSRTAGNVIDLLDIPLPFRLDTPERIAAHKQRVARLPPPKHRLGAAAAEGKIFFNPKLVEQTRAREIEQARLAALEQGVLGAFAGKQLTYALLRAALPQEKDEEIRDALKRLVKSLQVIKVQGTIRWCLRGESKTAVAPPKTPRRAEPTSGDSQKSARRSGRSKTELIREMLLRKGGCTRPQVLEATGWTAVSMQQQAKACGLMLRQEKEDGKPTVYYGSTS